jgi:uncharacterized membrane protein (DUF4010 family)
LWQATTLANAVQFPRVLALIAALNFPLAIAMAWPLLVMSAVGLALSFLPVASNVVPLPQATVPLRNPFRLRPALRFGVIFALMLVISRAATAIYGTTAVYVTSLIGGLIDVDVIVVSTSELQATGRIAGTGAKEAIFLALLMNALFKTGLAYGGGNRVFGLRVALSFVVMLAVGGAMLWFGWP